MMKKHNIISKTICYSLSVRSFSLSLVLVSNKNIKKKKTFATYMEYNAFQSQTLREFGPVRKVDKRSWKILMGQKEHSLNDSLNYYNEAEYYSIPRDKKFIPFPETKNIKKSIVLPVREVKPDIRLKETIDNNKKSAKTNYNESSVSNNTENSHKKLSIRQSLQTIGSYPLLGNPETKLPYMEYLQPMLTALPREPSVGNILRETMSEQSKAALDRWMKMKIKELGEEGFQQYKQDLFSTGSNFHSCVAAKLQNKPEIPLKPKTEPLWESVQSVFTDISEVEMVEATTTHKELGYMGILDGVIRYRDELVLVDWKTSDREKKTLDAAYDDPVQVLAYMGAVNSDSSCNLTVKDGLLVVAYRDGRPADVLKIPGVLCHMYWKKWLARLYKYWSFRLI